MSNVSKSIDDEFRWETLLNRIKKSSFLVERLQHHHNPMLNFKLEKTLVELMKTLTQEEQALVEHETFVIAGIQPLGMNPQEFKELQNDLMMDSATQEEQYKYACSLPIEANEKKLKWFTKLAEKQHRDSQHDLGAFYDRRQDFKQAVFWYTKAATQGCNASKNNLAVYFRTACGVEKDEKRAFQLYLDAANNNNSRAQANLGNCYEHGYGVEKNIQKAFELYKKSMENGNLTAYALLGDLYKFGNGVEKNLKKAYDLYLDGATQGSKPCQKDLAICFLNGYGVKKDVKAAFRWFLQASDNDKERAISFMKEFDYADKN